MNRPLILAVETSGRLGSIALALGDDLLAQASFSAPMRHSAEIFPSIENLLARFNRKPSQIEQVYISIGPGSFTGLRIAVTIAKIFNLANSAKIVSVDTLDLLASNIFDFLASQTQKPAIETVAAILDAKRGQFFISTFNIQSSALSKLLPDSIMTAAQFLEYAAAISKPIYLLGEGLVYYKDKFKAHGIEILDESFWYPKAANLHKLGWQLAQKGHFADPLTFTPNYVMRPDIVPPKVT